MTDFDSSTMNGLAEKLDALDLTTAERAALDCIIDRAADDRDGDEVVGFTMFDTASNSHSLKTAEHSAKVKAPDLSVPGIKIANALGLRF